MSTQPSEPPLSREFLAALQPLARYITHARTLSSGKLGILRHLARHDRATSSELAGTVQVSPQAISLAARELEDLGLLSRAPDPDDRRRTWLVITDAGRQTLAEETAAGERVLDDAINARLTADDTETLRAAIAILTKLVT